MKKLLIIAALVSASATATAQVVNTFFNGNELLTEMNSSKPFDRGLATGYIVGVLDASHDFVCPPKNVSSFQARDIIRKYLETSPEDRHFTARSIIKGALAKAWPCAK